MDHQQVHVHGHENFFSLTTVKYKKFPILQNATR